MDDRITIDNLSRERIKENIFKAFNDHIPNIVIAFYDDDHFPEEISQHTFVDNKIVVVSDNMIAIGNYDSRSSLIFDCFCMIVDHGGEISILKKIYNDDYSKLPKYIAGCSHMIHRAWLMCLVYHLMAIYGFYFEYDDNIHLEIYSRVFHMVFHEYDDNWRNRLSRRDLYVELVRWDYRNKNYFSEEKYGLTKEGMFEISEEEKANRHKLFVACKEEFERYPFAGDNLLGTFISGYGYFSPGEKTPTYVKIVEDLARKDKVVELETNEEMKKLLEQVYWNYHISTFTLLKCLNADIKHIEPRLSQLRFIKSGKDKNGDKILIITDEYYTANIADLIVDRARMYAIMDLPIADLIDSPKTVKELRKEESKEDEENNGNS